MNKPVVFLGADVIFAGAAATTEQGTNHVVLRLGEITLIVSYRKTVPDTFSPPRVLWTIKGRDVAVQSPVAPV
jgi:hypothetical protein